ncbi:MAG: HAD-IIIA family hydrolase [Negativicutes bacterium]|nr:HAD-IIIA family hydrolase [Negativicutes bacterium]
MGTDSGRPLILVDRDGVVNELVYCTDSGEWESPRTVADVRFRDGAVAGLKQLAATGWQLALVSNQPSAAKGKCRLTDLQAVRRHIAGRLAEQGVAFLFEQYCWHHPLAVPGRWRRRCDCRKPETGALERKLGKWQADRQRLVVIGDQDCDWLLAGRLGAEAVLLDYPYSRDKRQRTPVTAVVADWPAVVRRLGNL